MAATFVEDAQGLALQPALNHIANLRRLRVLRQADVQREVRHAGQGVGEGVQHRSGGARIDHHDHRLAEELHFGAVAPGDAIGLRALSLFAPLLQLAQDPGGFFAQRAFDVGIPTPSAVR